MSILPSYAVWEYGKGGAPPTVFDRHIDVGEMLVWSAKVPSPRLQKGFGWLFLFGLLVGLTGFFGAPWGQSMAEYCAADQGRSCGKFYILTWPMLALGVWLTAFAAIQAWKSAARPWTISIAVTTKRALWMDSRKPDTVRSVTLQPRGAHIDWAGNIRFNKYKLSLSFTALDEADAARVVYWANEGRFHARSPIGAEH